MPKKNSNSQSEVQLQIKNYKIAVWGLVFVVIGLAISLAGLLPSYIQLLNNNEEDYSINLDFFYGVDKHPVYPYLLIIVTNLSRHQIGIANCTLRYVNPGGGESFIEGPASDAANDYPIMIEERGQYKRYYDLVVIGQFLVQVGKNEPFHITSESSLYEVCKSTLGKSVKSNLISVGSILDQYNIYMEGKAKNTK